MKTQFSDRREFLKTAAAAAGVVVAGAGLTLPIARADEKHTVKPAFAIRGTLPWHNFLSGPSAWNESDYRAYMDDLAAKGLNFVAFHCYTGGEERYAPYVEPLIQVKYRDVLPEAGLDTSLTARWGYRPLSVQEFVFGTANSFDLPAGTHAFGADCAVTAHSNEDRYRQAQSLMRKVIKMAHERGIQVAMGFEFGIHPPELASIVPHDSRIAGAMLPDPTHPANIEILQATVDDVVTSYPGIDWVWLWLHEHSHFVAPPQLSGRFREFYNREKANFSGASNEHDVFTGVWSLAQVRQVHEYLARRSPKTRLVIGGWGGLLPVLPGLDRALPRDIVFSCLSDSPVLGEVAKHRPTWAVPWLEYDGWLWHLQLQAAAVSKQVKAAHAANLTGVIGIHWRTEEIRPNLEALALTARDPEHAPPVEELYRQHCVARYGPASVDKLAPLLLRFENEKQLGCLDSPEFYPYTPSWWGRVEPKLARQLRDAITLLDQIKCTTPAAEHRANLDWLADNFRFTLLLDEVGRKLEPAYALKERHLRGEVSNAELPQQVATASRELAAAPVEELFRTFARRVRSRGELGELSALNQKLWLQYRELDRFLASVEKAR